MGVQSVQQHSASDTVPYFNAQNSAASGLSDGNAWKFTLAVWISFAVLAYGAANLIPALNAASVATLLTGLLIFSSLIWSLARLILSKPVVDFTTFSTCLFVTTISGFVFVSTPIFLVYQTTPNYEDPIPALNQILMIGFLGFVISDLIASKIVWNRPLAQLVLANIGLWIFVAAKLYSVVDHMRMGLLALRP